ncbi:MAG: DUF2281 domain-containing protein [Lachnospiraceae bacterium]|nr:DUF2281 domain-containing protein [Lachnospiraceae bacterium]
MGTDLIMKEMEKLSENKKQEVFNFILFLKTRPDMTTTSGEVSGKHRSIIGRAKEKITMAPDFNDTPECFKEYV